MTLATFMSATAHAETLDYDKIQERAISLAEMIETQNLVVSKTASDTNPKSELPPSKQIEASRTALYDVIFTGDSTLVDAELESHRNLVHKFGTQRDKDVLGLFEKFLGKFTPDTASKDYELILNNIDGYFSHSDWFVVVQAHAIKCTLAAMSVKRIEGLESAQKALTLIPNQVDAYTHEAQILITDAIVLMHNMLHNTDLALINTERLIELKLEAEQPIDGIELLNNLLYAFGTSRDHKISLEIAETLKRLEQNHDSTTPGLTDMRLAQVYADTGDFESVKEYAQKAIKSSEIDAITKRTQILLAIAEAGLGNTSEARKVIENISDLSEYDERHYLYAKALIAQAENRTAESVKHFNARQDLAIKNILDANNQDTADLLATLENSRERQAERESALIREAELKAQKLAEEEKKNRLLMSLLALIGAALVASLLFARYRDKTSKLLAIKTREAESADRMKTEFLGMISHELRTPLNGIIGIADFMATRHEDEDVREKSGIILQSGNILFNLVESIIDMSRLDSGRLKLFPEPQNLAKPLEATAQNWEAKAAAKGLTYTYFISDDLNLTAEFDETRLTQCLDGLIDNAVKFTDKGRVHVHITRETREDGQIGLQAIIADTGMGIEEDVQTKLFKPFLQADSSMTRKFNGSGLTLAITRSMARMMGGDVTLVSKAGRGSEFILTAVLTEHAQVKEPATTILEDAKPSVPHENASIQEVETIKQAPKAIPASKEEWGQDVLPANFNPDEESKALVDVTHDPDEDPDEDILDLMILAPEMHSSPRHQQTATDKQSKIPIQFENPDDLTGVNVLIVEDVKANQDVLKLLLAPQGCLCLTADSGEDALEVLKGHPVDIILMDIRMPGIDGVETTRIVRHSETPYKDVPIIAITADADSMTNAECMAAGANLFLTKPIIKRELIDAIVFLREQEYADRYYALRSKTS